MNSVPETVHASEGSGVGGKVVGSMGEYEEEKALGDTVA